MTPLRRRMIEDMTLRNFTPATIRAYVQCVARFVRHFQRRIFWCQGGFFGPGHPGRLPAPGSHRSGLARRGGIRLFISCRYQREPVSCVDMV
jgi:hypothetical protein